MSGMWGRLLSCLWLFALLAFAEELPKGRIVEDVKCAANPNQSYALYLPSNYTPDRPWSVIFAFDPRARGRAAVERFEAAAEKYGYIVAGSNNSRNGSWQASTEAISAVTADVGGHFAVDAKRIYTAGLSGGARVAMEVALGTNHIAGVIASSAGFPDSRPRKSISFAVFGTAGTEDFNYLEMRQLDRVVTTPHRVVIFEGGHTWLSSELAVEALEWMEVQAMKSGRRTRDDALIEKLFAVRLAQANAQSGDYRACLALEALAADFAGLRDVAEIKSQAAALHGQKKVKDAAKKDRADLDREERQMIALGELQNGMRDSAQAAGSLEQLKDRLQNLAREANAPEDSGTRRMARRLLRGISAGARETSNPELRKILDKLGVSARPGA